MTGFESTITIGIAIATLIALLWRALGRHVTVNNTNSPSANATATSEPSGQGGSHRSIVGPLVSLGIIVAVIALAVAAFDLRASLSTPQPAPVVIEKVITPSPIAATSTPIEVPAEYEPIALPAVNTTLDLTPIALLAIMAVAMWFISRRTSKPAQIQTVKPTIIDAPIPISAERPLQEVMKDRKS